MTTEDLSSLSVFPATHEQIIEAHKRGWLNWGEGRTTEEQYLQWYATALRLEHASNGKMATWVLAPRDDPTTMDFRCACDSFRRKALVIRQHETHKVEEVTCYGLHAVLTPPKLRRKGYARHMLRLMHWVFASSSQLSPLSFPDSWGKPPAIEGYRDAQFSVLYSDIGEQFYLGCGPGEQEGDGWLVRGSISTFWDVDPNSPISTSNRNERWEWLDEAGVDEIWKKDAKTMETEFAGLAASSSSEVLFTFLPDNGLAAYQNHCASLYPNTHVEHFTRWGIVLPETGEDTDKPTFATWTIDTPNPTLLVTRLRTSPSIFPFILSKIMDVARDAQLTKVEVWNLPKELTDVAGGQTIKRDIHHPSFKWYGDEKPECIEWVFNENAVFASAEP